MKLFIRAHDLGVKGETDVLNKLDELGLDGVQLVAYKVLPDIAYAAEAMTEQRARQIAQAFRQRGKTVPLIGAYFNPVHSNPAKVAQSVAVFENYLRQANNLGCGIVGSETGSYNDDKWTYNEKNRTDEALGRVVETFTHLADYADSHGACVAIEGAYNHVCYDVARLKQAVDGIGRKNVKVIFDLYNYLCAENASEMYDILEEGLKTFGDKLCVFHLKDCVIEGGELKQCGVGKGIFDYPRILQKIHEYLPCANLVFEGTVGDDIPFAVKYIKDIIRRLQ